MFALGPHLELPPRPPPGATAHPSFSLDSGELPAEQKQTPAGLPKALLRQSSPGQRLGEPPGPSGDVKPDPARFRPGVTQPGTAAGLPPSPLSGPRPEPPPWVRRGAKWAPPSGAVGGGVRGAPRTLERDEVERRSGQTPQPRLTSQLIAHSAPRRPQTRQTVPWGGVSSRHPVPRFSSANHSPREPRGHLPIPAPDRGTTPACRPPSTGSPRAPGAPPRGDTPRLRKLATFVSAWFLVWGSFFFFF